MKREEIIKELKEMELIKFYVHRCTYEIDHHNNDEYNIVWNLLTGAVQMYLQMKSIKDIMVYEITEELF